MSKRRGHDFDQVKTNAGRDKAPAIHEQVDLFKFPPDTFVTLRIISPIYLYAGYWVKTKTKEGKPTKFYMPSPSFSDEIQTFDSTVYDPFYEYSQTEKGVSDKEDRLVQISTYGYCCAIILAEEKKRPARLMRPTEQELKSGFKDKDSESWTPVKVLRLSSTVMDQIKGIVQTNVVTNKRTGEKKAMSIAHPQFGMTIRIKHSPKKAPALQYQVLPGERAPLTERQAKYLTWDLSDLERPDDEAEIKRSYERWAKAMGVEAVEGEEGDGFDDEDEAPRSRSKGRGKPAGRGRNVEEDFDDADAGEESWDEDGEEEEAPPPRRKPTAGKKPAPKRRPEPEDDFDEEGGEDEDWGDDGEEEEEEEAPPARRKSSGKPAPKRRSEPEEAEEDWGDDDDGGEDWSDDGEEEEAPPPRRKPAGKPAPKRRPAPEPEDEDWGDDDATDDGEESWDEDGEEEEEAPPPRRKPAAGKKPTGKPAPKRRPAPEEEDWGDDDDIPF